MNRKRILALLLAALMLTSVGCAGGETTADTSATAADTTPVETEPEYVMWQNLPDTTLNGYDFRILEYTPGMDTGATILHGDAVEVTGEAINDAIYNRNREVEERFDVTISTEGVAWGNVAGTLEKAVSAGDDSYSLGMGAPTPMVSLMMKNALLNLYEVENMDLSNPWYSQKQVERFTIQDKLFIFMGDISYSTLMFGACMIYNVDLAERIGLPYIHDVVTEGEWTIDKMYEMTEGVAQDLNGDGEFRENDDQFAYSCQGSGNLMNFMFSSDANFIMYDDESDTFVNTFNLEKVQTIVEKMYRNFHDSNRGVDAKDYTKLFNDSRVLLRSAYVGSCINHQEMEDTFTPIPYPKFDTAQEEYLSMMTGSVQEMGIPTTVSDPAAVGLIVEAMSEHSAGDLNDAVYEKVLSYQTMRSEDAMEILKIIHESLIVDFGYLTATGNADKMKWIVGDLVVGKKSTDVASHVAKYEKSLVDFYDNMLADFTELG